MKKVWAWVCLFVFLALVLLPFAALAEEAVPVKFELTEILQAAISLVAAVVAACAAYVWRKWLKPWLVQRDLMQVAEVVVAAAEAALGRYHGEEKWDMALEKMADYGYDIDSATVIDALNAAWKKLDLTQMMAGEKQPEETKPPEESIAE